MSQNGEKESNRFENGESILPGNGESNEVRHGKAHPSGNGELNQVRHSEPNQIENYGQLRNDDDNDIASVYPPGF